jgi:hypothetical protein
MILPPKDSNSYCVFQLAPLIAGENRVSLSSRAAMAKCGVQPGEQPHCKIPSMPKVLSVTQLWKT